MDSLSYRDSCDNDCCDKHDCCNTVRNHPIPSPAFLRANTGSFGPTTINILATLLNVAINQPVASVTIDTACLKSPTILVNFEGTLTSLPLAATPGLPVSYNFTLYRTCGNNRFREELRSFSISEAVALIALQDGRGLSFAYTQCEADCDDCCTYTLELTSMSSTAAISLIVIIIGTLSVLAVDSAC